MTGIIILAAGPSSRLGLPKQNLVYENQTLLQRNIKAALATGCHPVTVILGANNNVILPTIENLPIEIAYNDNWIEGMSSSIRTGITHLQKNHGKISSVILMLCDQPFVTTDVLLQLVEASSPESIVACAYNDAVGPPVFFARHYFPHLLLLKGNEGAKLLIHKYEAHVITIPFGKGDMDIDTMEDFERLKGLSK